jgi:roadblock/LC7 domain-containing protein
MLPGGEIDVRCVPLLGTHNGEKLSKFLGLDELRSARWVPQHGWAYTGGEWTACIGDGGRRGVFVETSKADFNRLFEALGDKR